MTNSSDSDNRLNVDAYESLRRQFRLFIGDDTVFRRFLTSCNANSKQPKRLTYLQEKLWKSFVNKNPEAALIEDATIIEIFHICHIHMCPLHCVEIPIRKGVWDITHSPEYNSLIAQNAPFSLSYSLDSQAWGEATHVTVNRCDKCFSESKRIDSEYLR